MNKLDKYKSDLQKLTDKGELLYFSFEYECFPNNIKDKEIIKKLPNFYTEYQKWYSEALILIKQLLNDRLDDFKRYYEKPKNRKQLDNDNYCIEDALQGIIMRNRIGEIIVSQSAALQKIRQQVSILKSISAKFESSLFDITQLLQADLFDSELKEAEELLKKGFFRASGAIAGVVLEKHLTQVLKTHNISIAKKQPGINDLNELLRQNNIIDVPVWRQIQRFADIRNLCDHNKDREPAKDEILELIYGVEKFTKTIY